VSYPLLTHTPFVAPYQLVPRLAGREGRLGEPATSGRQKGVTHVTVVPSHRKGPRLDNLASYT
jgi:hypothetical protein